MSDAKVAAMTTLIVESIANEYRTYRAWAQRRKSIHVVPVEDFCRGLCATMELDVARVVACVERQRQ